MKEFIIAVENSVGLHARPAANLAKLAMTFESGIKAVNESNLGKVCNVKSVISIMSLGAKKGHLVKLTIEGSDEAEAATAIQALASNNFGE